jgi:hypothetical protein
VLLVVAADLTFDLASPDSLRLRAATVHINADAASPSPPASGNDDGSDSNPFTKAVVTGAFTFTGATGRIDEAPESVTGRKVSPPVGVTSESLADDPVSPGVDVEDDEADDDDLSSEPPLDEPPAAAEASARWGRRELGPRSLAPVGEPAVPADEASPVEEPLLEEPPCVVVRDDPDDEPPELEPVEPPEPVVSAKATGMDPIAAPTPNATANAPTRPTQRAYPDVEGLRGIARWRPSSTRTPRVGVLRCCSTVSDENRALIQKTPSVRPRGTSGPPPGGI